MWALEDGNAKGPFVVAVAHIACVAANRQSDDLQAGVPSDPAIEVGHVGREL